MFEVGKGLTQWTFWLFGRLFKKKLHKHENSTNFIRTKHKKIKVNTQWALVPLWTTLLLKTEKLSKHSQQKNMTSCWKALDHSINNREGLLQWSFVSLDTTLNYKTSNLNTLIKILETNKFIDWYRWKIYQAESSPRPSTSPQGKQIRMSGLDMSHWKSAITPNDKFQDQWTLIQYIWYTQFNN